MTLPLLFPNQKTWMTVQFNIDTLYIVWRKKYSTQWNQNIEIHLFTCISKLIIMND